MINIVNMILPGSQLKLLTIATFLVSVILACSTLLALPVSRKRMK